MTERPTDQVDPFSPETKRLRHKKLFDSKLAAIASAPDAPRVVYVIEEKLTDAAAVLQYGGDHAYKLSWHIDYNTTAISSMKSEIERNISYRESLDARYGTITHLYRVRAIDLADRPWP